MAPEGASHAQLDRRIRSARRGIADAISSGADAGAVASFAAIRQLNDDKSRSPSRASTADRKALAIKRVVRINHPHLSDSPVKRCGIPQCSVIQPLPMLCSTVWSTALNRLELRGESLRKLRAAKNVTLDEETPN